MKVLITDFTHDFLVKGLQKSGFDVNYEPDIPSKNIKGLMSDVDILITNSKSNIDEVFLESYHCLKLVVRLGSGLDIADVNALQKRNITIFNTPEGNADSVAEHCIGMILAYNNHMCISSQQIANNQWLREPNRGNEILGKTIGIIGYGNTGKAFAKRLSGFGVNVLAYDKYLENYTDASAKETCLEQIQEQSDIISVHLPLTAETNGLINLNFFKSCDKKPLIVNTARGSIVSMSDILEALNQGYIRGACLDVFEYEPLIKMKDVSPDLYDSIMKHTNLLFTPHIAGWTYESKERIARIALSKILAYINHR